MDEPRTPPGAAAGPDRTARRRPPPARGGRPGRATRRLHPHQPCLNCGDSTEGEFCRSCGQRKVDVQVSLKAMLADVLEDELTVDHRLPTTLAALFFRPGRLTVDYVNGRIVRYIRPFRLYLVSSVIFFLLLSATSLRLVRGAMTGGDRPVAEVPDTLSLAEVDADADPAPAPGADAAPRDSDTMAFLDGARINTGFARLDSLVAANLRELRHMEPRQAAERLVGDFISYIPTLMFILLPLFAAVLKVLYVRRRRYYAEHFVFLLHTHSVIYLLFAVALVLGIVGWRPGWFFGAIMLWIPAYVLLAMKRVYGQGWAMTILKWWSLGWMYFWILSLALPVATVATLLLL